MAGTNGGREVGSEGEVSRKRVESFRRLMAAQEQIAAALTPHGLTDAQLDEALAAAEEALPRDEHDERDFYLPALERYVAALGGRLESRAVFPEATVMVDRAEQP